MALPIADGREVWLMEIFGPGNDWTPDSGRPGGVWCAQRIPDDEVGCSANRSRIGVVDLNDPDHFPGFDVTSSPWRKRWGSGSRERRFVGTRYMAAPGTGAIRSANGAR